MSRRRSSLVIPEEMRTTQRLSTKKELAAKAGPYQCPYVPAKVRKSGRFYNSPPVPICFATSVTLSPLYNPNLNDSYFEQVFTNHTIVGKGSFGKVYRVKSREDSKWYGVKHLRSHISLKDRHAEVNNNEIVGSHKNCVQFYMAWEEREETYMLLEYCEMSLADYSRLNNNIPEELLWNALFDMCKALEFLHKRNLLHLDIKPGNILMKKGFYKLGDFGLLANLDKNDHIKKSTLSEGDSKYLAMEVLEGIYTPKCDIFGLGVTILELSADLELPDHGPLWQQLRHGILPSAFYQRATLALRMIVMKMIHMSYETRPSAEKILSFINLKDVAKRDLKKGRVDYAAPFVTQHDSDEAISLTPLWLNSNNNELSTNTPLGRTLVPLSWNNNNESSTSTPQFRTFSCNQSNDDLFGSKPETDENMCCSIGAFNGRKSLFTARKLLFTKDDLRSSPSNSCTESPPLLGFNREDDSLQSNFMLDSVSVQESLKKKLKGAQSQ